jgi:hypothetical protein
MPVVIGHFGAAVAAVFGVAAAFLYVTTGYDPEHLTGPRIAAAVAVVLLGLVSRVSIAQGGFATADFIVRNSGVIGADAIGSRLRAAEVRLAGIVLTLGVVATGSGWWLTSYGETADRLVAALVGVCLVLRSRLFEQTWPAVPLAVLGAGVVGVAGYHLVTDRPTGLMWLTPVAVASAFGALLAVLKGLPIRTVPSGPGRRLLYWGETTAMIAMICALANAFAPDWTGDSAAALDLAGRVTP